jgi:hypothetical protein
VGLLGGLSTCAAKRGLPRHCSTPDPTVKASSDPVDTPDTCVYASPGLVRAVPALVPAAACTVSSRSAASVAALAWSCADRALCCDAAARLSCCCPASLSSRRPSSSCSSCRRCSSCCSSLVRSASRPSWYAV